MTKSEYLARFSQNVKWRLSYQEAEEVIEDYEGFFSQSSHNEQEVCLALGNPASAAKSLSDHLSYRYWLIVFSIQAVALFMPYFILLASNPPLSYILSPPSVRPYTMLTLTGIGILVSLFFFRPRRNFMDKTLPKTIIFFLGLLCLLAVVIGVLIAVFFNQLFNTGTIPAYSYHFSSILFLSGTLFIFAGLWALINSRISDRRYRALYILSLTLLLLCYSSFNTLTSLDLSGIDRIYDSIMQELKFNAIIGGIGILACGGSLC